MVQEGSEHADSCVISQWLTNESCATPKAVDRFYRRIQARLHAGLRRRGLDARDFAQDVFLELVRRRDRIQVGPREYAHGIATLKLYEAMRRYHHRCEVELSRPDLDGVAAESLDAPAIVEQAKQVDALVGLLGELPIEDQRTVALIYGRGLKNVELARRLGLDCTTLNNHLGRIRRRLRARLLAASARGTTPTASQSFSAWVESVLPAGDDQPAEDRSGAPLGNRPL